jgi:cell division protein ZapE
MPGLLRKVYHQRLAAGLIGRDPAQQAAMEALSRVETGLVSARRGGLFRRTEAVAGAYLWGPVGRGKSMLMDLFFDTVPVRSKRRVHFHVFMAEVHALVNAWRTGDAAARRARFGETRGDNPIPPLARVISGAARLLCFDELQVTDIADAMILGRLFEALFGQGVTLVSTSNRPPDDLYKDGVNRGLFLPFIALIKERMTIVPLAGDHDYRLDRPRAARTWLSPIDPDNEREFDGLWRDALDGAAETGVTLEVLGRQEHWPRASGRAVRAHFASLCGHALGPADYLAIAGRFDTVFIEAIPRLGPEKRDEARRLATLIDTLYEAHARLVVLAAGEPDGLYPAGDLAFEFERTASRLKEMRSAAWLAQTSSRRNQPDGDDLR